MKATVCKILDFPASHSNSHHDGHCRNLHGHTWTLEVYCFGEIVFDQERPDYGMVVDFHKVKDAYRKMVEPWVEHEHLNNTLSDVLPEFTTELVAAWIFKQMREEVSSLHKIRLWEGKSSFAEVNAVGLIHKSPGQTGDFLGRD